MENNNLDIDRLYNGELKGEYLDKYKNKNTKNTAYFDLLIVSNVENDLQKDAYTFNDLEVREVLRVMESSSNIGVRRMLSTLNDYVSWCIENGKRGNSETYRNSVQEFISGESNLNKYISNKQISGKILDEDEFNDLLNVLVNPSDVALILCMYNFISGKEMYEIRNLKRESIDKENSTIYIKEDEDRAGRSQRVSKQLIDELLLTDDVEFYYSSNGEVGEDGKNKQLTFVDSDFIFKPTGHAGDDFVSSEPISASSLYSKLRQIKIATGYNFISPTSLRDTRLVHEVWKKTKELKADFPTKGIVRQTIAELHDTYGLQFSHMQMYSLEKKIEKLIAIGKFN